MTTLGTRKKWSLFRGGRYSEGQPVKLIFLITIKWQNKLTLYRRWSLQKFSIKQRGLILIKKLLKAILGRILNFFRAKMDKSGHCRQVFLSFLSNFSGCWTQLTGGHCSEVGLVLKLPGRDLQWQLFTGGRYSEVVVSTSLTVFELCKININQYF